MSFGRCSEFDVQASIIRTLAVSHPNITAIAIPNERTKGSKSQLGRLKAAGMVTGCADLILCWPDIFGIKDGRIYGRVFNAQTCFFETKRPKTNLQDKGRQTQQQKHFQEWIWGRGFNYVVGYSIDDCLDYLKSVRAPLGMWHPDLKGRNMYVDIDKWAHAMEGIL